MGQIPFSRLFRSMLCSLLVPLLCLRLNGLHILRAVCAVCGCLPFWVLFAERPPQSRALDAPATGNKPFCVMPHLAGKSGIILSETCGLGFRTRDDTGPISYLGGYIRSLYPRIFSAPCQKLAHAASAASDRYEAL